MQKVQLYTGLSALATATFPVLYFFTFLYYTDIGSTFFILYSYLLSLQRQHCISAAVGTVAVIFRQTNIVWVMFFCLCVIFDMLVRTVMPDKQAFLISNDHTVIARLIYSWLRYAIHKDSKLLFNLISQILLNIWPYCVVFLAFGIFLWINGGIVVGARHDHEVTLHFPQLFYYAVFTVWFAAVNVVSWQNVVAFVKFVKRYLLLNICLFLLCLCVIWRYTYVHRYVLADNRHYTFYIWSRLFAKHPLMRYAFAPVYLFSGYIVLQTLALRRHFLWCITYVLSVTLLLVPTTLLEFRYYIVPYIIFRLNIPVASLRQLVAEISMYVGINLLTIYVFLHRPFQWNSEASLQRFMW